MTNATNANLATSIVIAKLAAGYSPAQAIAAAYPDVLPAARYAAVHAAAAASDARSIAAALPGIKLADAAAIGRRLIGEVVPAALAALVEPRTGSAGNGTEATVVDLITGRPVLYRLTGRSVLRSADAPRWVEVGWAA